MKTLQILLLAALAGVSFSVFPQNGKTTDSEDLLNLSLNDLLQIEVSSVSRRLQVLREAAAAVHVITADDIRRSGVTSIPEALRMVPGISVARINASNWAITARGFNGGFSNKLLVLIDGRTVYTPAFSGVYWDVQDTVLDNIERIEVIRGPGATLWGANAVNGIINIITKSAADTQGGLLLARVGNEEEGTLSLRYGDQVGAEGAVRGHLKLHRTDEQRDVATGADANDQWKAGRAGFRFDTFLQNGDAVTLQGDWYHSESDQTVLMPGVVPIPTPDRAESTGWNIAGKWQREFVEGGAMELSAYLDSTHREELPLTQEHLTLDVDFQHDLRKMGRHNVIWGVGYRRIEDDFTNTSVVSLSPASAGVNLFSGFVQDEITLSSELRLTLGTKLEHNAATGIEWQPNARLAWIPDEHHIVWGAVSRAVRTPSRVERESRLHVASVPAIPPIDVFVLGNPNLESETLLAYEAGYRFTRKNFGVDLAMFLNDYDDLITQDFAGPTSVVFLNRLKGRSTGLELTANWKASAAWHWQLAYAYQHYDLRPSGPLGFTGGILAGEGSTPTHQLSLRSSIDLSDNLELDVWGRWTGKLKASNVGNLKPVPSYSALDMRLGWQVSKQVELSLVGKNLLDSSSLEFVHESFFAPTEIERSVFGQLKVTF